MPPLCNSAWWFSLGFSVRDSYITARSSTKWKCKATSHRHRQPLEDCDLNNNAYSVLELGMFKRGPSESPDIWAVVLTWTLLAPEPRLQLGQRGQQNADSSLPTLLCCWGDLGAGQAVMGWEWGGGGKLVGAESRQPGTCLAVQGERRSGRQCSKPSMLWTLI